MPLDLTVRLVDLLAFAALAAIFLLIGRSNIPAQVAAFAWQSWIITALTAVIAIYSEHYELLGVAVVLGIIKGWLIPRVMNRAVERIGINRESAPYISTTMGMIVAGILVALSFEVLRPLASIVPPISAGAFPLAFAGVLIGLFMTIIRRRALTQILGFLVLENSIFMFTLLVIFGVPLIVEVGVFLDLLVAVLIMELFVYRIKQNFDTIDVDRLGELKG